MTKGVNETSEFTSTVSAETTSHVPNATDHGVDAYDVRGRELTVAKLVNSTDADATVTLEATTSDDAGFAEGVDATSSKTATAGGGTAGFAIKTAWSFVRLRVETGVQSADADVKGVFNSSE